MERILKRGMSEAIFKLQKSVLEISTRTKGIAALINLEHESTESKKAFYFLSIVLLVFLIFLSPDKIPQMFAPPQADIGFLERVHETARLIKKLMPSFS